jgi:succinate dehydrogenase / fumarate reductase iron-sulfur subunit
MTNFFKQYHAVSPYLVNADAPPDRKRLQSPAERELLNGAYECFLCAYCSSQCPSYWWNPDTFLGPAGLIQAYRFIVDRWDHATLQRLDDLHDAYRLFRCCNIMNCAEVCPKGLGPDGEDQVDDGETAAGPCWTSNASAKLSDAVEGCPPRN